MHLVNSSRKYCPYCDQTLDHALFGVSNTRKDGLSVYCRGCTNAYARARRAKNKDALREYRRQYAVDNHWRIVETHRAWRSRNREAYNAYQRAWRAKQKPT